MSGERRSHVGASRVEACQAGGAAGRVCGVRSASGYTHPWCPKSRIRSSGERRHAADQNAHCLVGAAASKVDGWLVCSE